jgi:bacteriocin biosynthesis cyclodehydratase domain-containing protein
MTALGIDPGATRIFLQQDMLVYLREGKAPLTLIGPEWAKLVDAVGTGAEAGELVARLSGKITSDRAEKMVMHLKEAGLLAPIQRAGLAGDAGLSGEPLTVHLTGLGEVDLDFVRARLEQSNVTSNDDAVLNLVVTDDYLRPELEQQNADRLADGKPWLLVAPFFREARIGPLFTPGAGPCWSCLQARHKPRHQSLRYLRAQGMARVGAATYDRANAAAAVAAAIPMLERFRASGAADPGASTVLTLDARTGTWRDHRLLRRPQRPICGDPAAAMPR